MKEAPVSELRSEKTGLKKFYTRPEVRVIAGVLVFAMLLSLFASGFVHVRIKPGSSEKAATNYLVDNTRYVGLDTVDRLQEKFRNLSQPISLEDYYRLAGIQIAEKDYEGALGSIENCLKLDDGRNVELHLDLLLKHGCLLVLLERYDEALISLDKVLLKAPNTADAILVKAQIYATQQDVESLIQTLEQYLQIESESTEIRLLLAQALFSTEDFEGAAEQYLKILESEDKLEEPSKYHYLYGLNCIQLSDFTAAQEHLLIALDSGNSYDDIHYYIGLCYMSSEAYEEAIEYLNTAIENESMLQLSHYSRGISGLMIENYDAEIILGDLAFAAKYEGVDADETISSQAAQLLKQLESETKG